MPDDDAMIELKAAYEADSRGWIADALREFRADKEALAEVATSLRELAHSYLEEAAEIEGDYEARAAAGEPPLMRMVIRRLRNPEALKAKAVRLLYRLRRLEDGKGVDDSTVERARAVPISKLLEVNRAGYALCPFHDDKKPSFWTKGGFGHCFVCNKTTDSIGYLMDIKGYAFKDAVEYLSRI